MKKDKALGVTFFCIFMTYIVAFIGIFYSMMIINNNTATYMQETISNTVCEANLSSAIVDESKINYIRNEDGTMTLIPEFIDTEEAYQKYEDCLKYNLNLEANGEKFNLKENAAFASKIQSVRIVDYVQISCECIDGVTYLYAVDKNGFRSLVPGTDGYYAIGDSYSTKQTCESGLLKSPDGVIISSPSVYSKIVFEVDFGFFSLNKEYESENTVSLYFSEV